MAKDHKEVGPDGEPKTCPVCTALQTMNMEMSEWVTGILDAVLETKEEHEVISTEEMLHKIYKLNMAWQSRKVRETESEEEVQEAKEEVEEGEEDVQQPAKSESESEEDVQQLAKSQSKEGEEHFQQHEKMKEGEDDVQQHE